jgi:hypothetical protein
MWAVGIERIEESRGERWRGYSTRDATIPTGTIHVREAENRWLGLLGALGTPAAGLHPRPTREKVFPSNLLLD